MVFLARNQEPTDFALVFARGMTINPKTNPYLADSVKQYWIECGTALRDFNNFVAHDSRVDVTMLPLFDGVSMIKWKVDTGKVNGQRRM